MREAIQLAFGYVLIEVPWYLLACVPFMGRRRISKRGIYLLAALMAAFRAATAFVLVLGVPNWHEYTALAYLPYYILLAALFLRAFRVSPARLAYVFLLVYSISTCVNQFAVSVLQLSFPGRRISMSAFPPLTVLIFGIFLALLPFLYRFFKGSLRQAVEELDTRSVLLLCVTPPDLRRGRAGVHDLRRPAAGKDGGAHGAPSAPLHGGDRELFGEPADAAGRGRAAAQRARAGNPACRPG